LVNDRNPRRGSGQPRKRASREGDDRRRAPRDGEQRTSRGGDGARRAADGGRRTARGEEGGRPPRTESDKRKRTSKGGEDRTRAPRAGIKRTARLGEERGRPSRKGDKRKRTSKSADDRNPTRSGIDYPSPKFRPKGGESTAAPAPPAKRASLRRVDRSRDEKPARKQRAFKARSGPPRRRRVKSTEAGEELARLAGRKARGAQEQLARAAEAFTAGRERDALKLLRPLRDLYPDASAVRELLGLAHYRLGNYAAAAKELDAFVELTDSVEQHPVLMDAMRAMGKYRRVDELWEELAAASPSSALVTEGRIVLAGTRADRGKVRDAIAVLDRRGADARRVQEHHLRLWYALADLYERAGEIPKARELFLRIRKHDAGFADVAERLAALR
jgi:thioredoxin-like negative regulator of GroEL